MSMSIEKKEVRSSKIRLSVPFSQTLYYEIEKESQALGVSMSSMVAFIVGQYLSSKNTMLSTVEQIMKNEISGLTDTDKKQLEKLLKQGQ